MNSFKPASISQLFEMQVSNSPDKIAVIFADQKLTYEALNTQANQLAHSLQNLGIQPQTRVGIYVERSLEMLVGLLAILKAGGTYIPLDPLHPLERNNLVLEDAQLQVILTQKHLIQSLPTHQAQVICLDKNQDLIAQHSTKNLNLDINPEQPAYIIYTSGSTGKPKGVEVPHQAVVNFLKSMQQTPGLTPEDVLLAVTTITFDISILELFLPLTVGAKIVITTREIAADGVKLSQELLTSGATVMQATPVTWQILKRSGWQGQKSLKMLCGGEALPRKLADWLLKKGKSLWNLYGPTETTVWSTIFEVQKGTEAVSIGRPINNTQIYLLDKQLQPVANGEIGELYIGGMGLANGYFNRPQLTAERFITNPFDNSTRLYKTGDLARYQPDGNLEYLGRIDHQVKIRGFRIELGEIEAILYQSSIIQEAVVIAQKDHQGDQRLVAYIIPISNHKQHHKILPKLRNLLKQRLPHYMIPSHFVFLNAFPQTASGKIDRKALPLADFSKNLLEDNHISPRTVVEKELAKIWLEILGLNEIGINHNFLDLGGNSLQATRIISRIQETYDLEIELRSLFENPTIAELAQQIENLSTRNIKSKLSRILPQSQTLNLPLSFAQTRLWFLDRLEPNTSVYNIPVALRLTGQLNLQVLFESFQQIIQRHESLRTTFQMVDENPVQVIQSSLQLKGSVIDLQALSATQREAQAQAILTQEAQQPFNLTQAPLWRVTVLQLDDQDYILSLVLHHILCDDWSLSIFCKELSLFYNGLCENPSFSLPQLTIQYKDFALWQHQWFQGNILEKQLTYWEQKIADLQKLQLPINHQNPSNLSHQGARQPIQLSQSLTEAIKDLSRQADVTLFMTLLAALGVLLYRYTDQEDIAINSPVANRHRGEVQGLIGFFVNLLILRIDLSGSPNFPQLLQRVRQVTLEAYTYQDLPFEKLVEELHLERDLKTQPLFNIAFALTNTHPTEELQLGGLNPQFIDVYNGTTKCDLLLQLTETPEGLSGYFEYRTDLFEKETIARMVGHFQQLLKEIVADLNQSITQLSILTPVEHDQLLAQWNYTQQNFNQNQCFHQRFESIAEQTPDAIAVVFEDQQLTYKQLNYRANQLAHYLQTLGVKPEVLVGLCVERTLDMIIGILGILKAGGAYLPLDPHYPENRLSFMLEDAQISLLLTQTSLVKSLPKHSALVVCLDENNIEISTQTPNNPQVQMTPENLTYVIYTSGSTGKAKGVLVQHRGLSNLTETVQHRFNITSESKILQFASLSFDASVWEIAMAFGSGGTLYLTPRETLLSGIALTQLLQQKAISIVTLPPSVLAILPKVEFPHLQTIIVAGEACPLKLAEYWSQGRRFFNAYGPTEATVCATMAEIPPNPKRMLIGRPIANTQVYILDTHLQPVPIGVPGELHIGGIGLARGYLNRPELTHQRFIPNPFDTEKKSYLYKTGDLVRYLSDGNLEFLGRIDHQVKIRGFRIELGEIEAVLSQHPAVQSVVVIDREDPPGQKRLVAYLELRSLNLEKQPLILEFRSLLRKSLPDYMMPATFVLLDQLPLSPNGKVDRRQLPIPPDILTEFEPTFIAPRNAIEQQMVTLWLSVLGLKRVGIHDNFFELGGNSLLAAQLITKISEVFKVDLPVRCLFETPTVEGLSQTLETVSQAGVFTPKTINLKAEVVLDAALFPQGQYSSNITHPQHIFITGSTGFLGAFLLHELLQKTQAKIYCLVREENPQAGIEKLQKILKKYGLWQPREAMRIIPIIGDLEKPLLGLTVSKFEQLAAQIDTIYHSGAQVNFVKPYSVLKTANVLGTQEIIKLATQSRIKPLHYISTAGVFGPISYFKECQVFYEHDNLDDYEDYVALDIGYSQSKWVAEQLIGIAKSRGFPITIMRPGFLLGHTQSGVTNTTDFWSRLIKGCIQIGSFPELIGQKQEFIPIDYVTQSIVHLSLKPESLGKVFHLTPPQHNLTTIELFNLIRSSGYALKPLSYRKWKQQLLQNIKQSSDNALIPLLPLFTEKVYGDLTIIELYQNNPDYDCTNTLEGLKDSSIYCPQISQELIKTYLSYFTRIGFLKSLEIANY
jgi:amino acid adenylation domain-containing protein/thioester reductase-like protein